MKNPVTIKHRTTVTTGALMRMSLVSMRLSPCPILLGLLPRSDPAFSETPSNAFFARWSASRVAMTDERGNTCFNTTDVLGIIIQ